jgi:hypothetical protein
VSLFSDLCRENPGSVGSNRRLGGIRDVNSIALRYLIDSDLEIGLEIFFAAAQFDASCFLRKLADSRAPVAQLDRASDYGSEGLRFESPRARAFFPSLFSSGAL